MARPALRSSFAAFASFGVLIAGVGTGCRTGNTSTLWLAESSWDTASTGDAAKNWADAPLAIDVDNPRGSVRVVVVDHLTAPEVETRTRWSVEDEPDHRWSDAMPPARVRVDADRDDTPARPSTLMITAEWLEGAPADVYTDIEVRLPRCDGVNVRTSDGSVVLVGVGGAIAVDNGRDFGPGGRIELRTNRSLQDPVALVTTEGRISVILTEASRGKLDLSTADGEAIFSTRDGALTNVRQRYRDWQGTWNGGENPIYARSGRGDVRFVITEDPEMYSVADGLFDPMDH